jgi:hypothetical protein
MACKPLYVGFGISGTLLAVVLVCAVGQRFIVTGENPDVGRCATNPHVEDEVVGQKSPGGGPANDREIESRESGTVQAEDPSVTPGFDRGAVSGSQGAEGYSGEVDSVVQNGDPDETLLPEGTVEYTAQTYAVAHETVSDLGPYADAGAIDLLVSTDPFSQVVGAVMFAQVPELDAEAVAENLGTAELWLQFVMLGWLRDLGRWEEAAFLEEMIQQGGSDAAGVGAIVDLTFVDAAGKRAVLRWLESYGAREDFIRICENIAFDDAQEVNVRMDVVLRLSRMEGRNAYLARLQAMSESPAFGEVWKPTLETLIQETQDMQVGGIEPSTDGEATAIEGVFSSLNSSDIRALWASERPYRLQELIARIECVLDDSASTLVPGTATELSRILKATSGEPWGKEDRLNLVRLDGLVKMMSTREDTWTELGR